MVKKLFAIYDSKQELYSDLIPFVSKGEAIRWFSDQANSDKSKIGHHPEDYTLFMFGEYDDTTCVVLKYTTLTSCGVGSEFKNVK